MNTSQSLSPTPTGFTFPLSSTSLLPEHGHAPSFTVSETLPHNVDAVIIPMFSTKQGVELAGLENFSAFLTPEYLELLTALGATGKANEVIKAPAPEGIEALVVYAVGLGSLDSESRSVREDALRQAAGTSSRAAQSEKHIASFLGTVDPTPAAEGHALGCYHYTGFQSTPDQCTEQFTLILPEDTDTAALTDALMVADAVFYARDLVNTPSNYLYPETYAQVLENTARTVGVTATVLDEFTLEEQGYGGIVAVGRGSVHTPRLVRLEWNPSTSDSQTPYPHVALVGKGITFDTGGISLKPGASMENMISDMGGSAAVAAAVFAAAQLNIPVKVTATLPLAENMPGGNATRPGDVIKHYGGKTSEILNTDAEGRLVLADAIARAMEDTPDFLIETATLTGAQMVALGNRTPGIMGSADFRDFATQVSQQVGDNGWAMPLLADVAEGLISPVADLRNITNTRWGGMSAAGSYLEAFVTEGTPWVHMDVAGPAFNTEKPYGYNPQRATGIPVRTILGVLNSLDTYHTQ